MAEYHYLHEHLQPHEEDRWSLCGCSKVLQARINHIPIRQRKENLMIMKLIGRVG